MRTGVRLGQAFILAVGLSAGGAHGAGKCEGDSAGYHTMPPIVGRPAATARTPYDLPCDSMVVPKGQTTIIYGSSILNFGSGTGSGGKIVVKGKLVIEGKPGNPAYLAGSIAPNAIGFAPGDRPWIGVQADSGGVLRISHARFYNATAALALSSRDVVLKNCFFKGTSALLLPDTSLALNYTGQSVSSLDLRDGLRASLGSDSDPSGEDGERRGGFRIGLAAKWLAGGAGVLAISGAIWWALRPGAKDKTSPADPSSPSTPDSPNQPGPIGIDAAPPLPEPGPAGS